MAGVHHFAQLGTWPIFRVAQACVQDFHDIQADPHLLAKGGDPGIIARFEIPIE